MPNLSQENYFQYFHQDMVRAWTTNGEHKGIIEDKVNRFSTHSFGWNQFMYMFAGKQQQARINTELAKNNLAQKVIYLPEYTTFGDAENFKEHLEFAQKYVDKPVRLLIPMGCKKDANDESGHMCPMVIDIDKNGKVDVLTIDSLGGGPNGYLRYAKNLTDKIDAVFGKTNVTKMSINDKKFQHDGFRCGDWTQWFLDKAADHLVEHKGQATLKDFANRVRAIPEFSEAASNLFAAGLRSHHQNTLLKPVMMMTANELMKVETIPSEFRANLPEENIATATQSIMKSVNQEQEHETIDIEVLRVLPKTAKTLTANLSLEDAANKLLQNFLNRHSEAYYYIENLGKKSKLPTPPLPPPPGGQPNASPVNTVLTESSLDNISWEKFVDKVKSEYGIKYIENPNNTDKFDIDIDNNSKISVEREFDQKIKLRANEADNKAMKEMVKIAIKSIENSPDNQKSLTINSLCLNDIIELYNSFASAKDSDNNNLEINIKLGPDAIKTLKAGAQYQDPKIQVQANRILQKTGNLKSDITGDSLQKLHANLRTEAPIQEQDKEIGPDQKSSPRP